MSERLTARSPRNGMAYLVNVKDDEQALDGRYNTLLCVRDAFERLATYEETGLIPSEIDGLKTASKEAAEILRDMVDVANATGSAYLYRRDTENVLRIIKALNVYPALPIAIHTDLVIPKTTPEMCSNCMREVEIPGNEPSKCPECGDDILPCSTCYDEIDGNKSCNWDKSTWCWRFPKTVSTTPKRYVDNRGWIYFVRAGIGGNTFKTFCKKDPQKPAGMGEHGYRSTPWCETFDHAQKNLDMMAAVNGWKEIT